MSNKNSEPAFPTRDDNYDEKYSGPGMALRDFFAAKAMQSIPLSIELNEQKLIATAAYQMADAMLKAREEV